MAKIKTKTDYVREFAETLAQRLNQSYMQELSLSYWEGMEDPQQRRFCADQLQLLEDGFGYGYDFRVEVLQHHFRICLLYTSPSPRDRQKSRMPSSA